MSQYLPSQHRLRRSHRHLLFIYVFLTSHHGQSVTSTKQTESMEDAEQNIKRHFYTAVDVDCVKLETLTELLHALAGSSSTGSNCLHAVLCCSSRLMLDDVASAVQSQVIGLTGSCLVLHADLAPDERASLIVQHQEAVRAASAGIHVLVVSDDAIRPLSNAATDLPLFPIGATVLINCDVPLTKKQLLQTRVQNVASPSGVALITLASSADSQTLASLQSNVMHQVEPIPMELLNDFYRVVFHS